NIVVPASATNNVKLDGNTLNSGLFINFPIGNQFAYISLKVTEGTHIVECPDGMLVYNYGIGPFESYLYASGFKINNLNFTDTTLGWNCREESVDVQLWAEINYPYKSVNWNLGNGDTAWGNPIIYHYKDTGKFYVQFVVTDSSNQVDSFGREIYVDGKHYFDSSLYPVADFHT